MLHKSFGDAGSSDSIFPARSALPLNKGQSSFPICASLVIRGIRKRKSVIIYLIFKNIILNNSIINSSSVHQPPKSPKWGTLESSQPYLCGSKPPILGVGGSSGLMHQSDKYQ